METTFRCHGGTPSLTPSAMDGVSHPHAHGRSRAALIWGVGSTVLSVLGFLGWGLFEQYNSSLAELRADLKHFNEASSTFVKRDAMQRFREHARAHFKDLQEAIALNKQLDAELKASEKARAEIILEMQRMRERLSFVEGRHSVAPDVHRAAPVTHNLTRNE